MRKIMLIVIGLVLVSGVLFLFLHVDQEKDPEQNNRLEGMDEEMNKEKLTLNLIIGETQFTATLEDNETTRELLQRLPLEIEMTELNGNEKYYYFDESLPSDASLVNKINVGDIMLFGSDCLVIFYQSFTTSYSYTKIGRIDNPNSLAGVLGSSNIKVKIIK